MSRVLESAGFLSSEFLRSCSFLIREACIVHFGAILRRRDVCIWERRVCVNTQSQWLGLVSLPLAQAFVLSHTSLVLGIFQQIFRQFCHQAGVEQVC